MEVQNPDVQQIAREQCMLNVLEGAPKNLLPNLQGVIDFTPRKHRNQLSAVLTTAASGATTVFTASSDKVTYLTGLMFSSQRNATCDIASGALSVSAVFNGTTNTIATMAALTLTADSQVVYIQFARPIKLDKGSLIRLGNNTFTAGNMTRSVVVYYYEVQAM